VVFVAPAKPDDKVIEPLRLASVRALVRSTLMLDTPAVLAVLLNVGAAFVDRGGGERRAAPI
jgi:hypothetical protein